MAGKDQRPFIDRPAARIVALLVLLLCAGSLAYLHRDDLTSTPEKATPIAGGDPAAACIEERFNGIDKMVDEGTVKPAQAALFKQRAEAMCRDTRDGNNPAAPPLPGLSAD